MLDNIKKLEKFKESLQDYLIKNVSNRLSGRSGEDFIGNVKTNIFAGVLLPRLPLIENTDNPKKTSDKSSLGLDFKSVPSDSKKDIELSISVKFSIYYSVFPTWDIISRESINSEESNGNELIIPVLYRRHEIETKKFNIVINLEKNKMIIDLSDYIKEAKNTINTDEDKWVHLGDPKDRKREVKTNIIINNRQAYEDLLGSIKQNNKINQLPDWKASILVELSRDINNPDLFRTKIFLSNETELSFDKKEDFSLNEPTIFDANITTEVKYGKIIPFKFLLAEQNYRTKPVMVAKGINCVVNKSEKKEKLTTETIPVYDQPLYRTRDDLNISFKSLDISDPKTELNRIIKSMDVFINDWQNYLNGPAKAILSESEIASCRSDLDLFVKERTSFILGLECLEKDKKLLKAFRLMNKAFYHLGQKSGGKMHSWRLFQICYIVSLLPSLMARELNSIKKDDSFEKKVMESFSKVSILWFPTGGGKTEAYLGLIATSLLYDRMRGKTRGVNTWMRFPLRMLSLQQLERLSKVIAELNILRSKIPEIETGDPFSVGFYVGNNVTPNRISKDDKDYFNNDDSIGSKYLQIRKCPYCDSSVKIKFNTYNWRLIHHCTNEKCFSNTSKSLKHLKGSLPLFIVDNEIYRYLPSVLVGTVDKLAIAGFNDAFSNIIKGSDQKCDIHGYTNYDTCLETYNAGCKNNKVSSLEKLDSIKDPGLSLLLQDELHLLKSELGTFNGHYEGFLQYVGDKTYMSPKVIAATATIEAYEKHAFHLYLKNSVRFPVPSWSIGESFYATSKPYKVRRKYVGILCHTKSVDQAASRLLHLYQMAIVKLKNNLTKVRKILNDDSLSETDINNILYLYDLSLAYVNKKVTGSILIDRLESSNIEFLKDGYKKLEFDFLHGDRYSEDIGNCLDRIESEKADTPDGIRLNVVVATSLISHGVDLERINMMTVCGMPSHYAEYVQSSSRAGRSHPGTIFSCFLSKDPRECSQYEMFYPMHENIDALIEPVAIHRFATFAPEKTIPGLLSALFMNDISRELYKQNISRSLRHVPTLKVALGLQTDGSKGTTNGCIKIEELKLAIEQIIGTDTTNKMVTSAEVENIHQRIDELVERFVGEIGRSMERNLIDVLKPMTSFRDVDKGLEFSSPSSCSLVSKISGR